MNIYLIDETTKHKLDVLWVNNNQLSCSNTLINFKDIGQLEIELVKDDISVHLPVMDIFKIEGEFVVRFNICKSSILAYQLINNLENEV